MTIVRLKLLKILKKPPFPHSDSGFGGEVPCLDFLVDTVPNFIDQLLVFFPGNFEKIAYKTKKSFHGAPPINKCTLLQGASLPGRRFLVATDIPRRNMQSAAREKNTGAGRRRTRHKDTSIFSKGRVLSL